MGRILLIRHAHSEALGTVLTGRLPDVQLTTEGHEAVQRLAARLATYPIHRVCSSPLQRTMATAEPIAHSHGLSVEPRAGLLEIDFGAWTGKAIAALEGDDVWRRFNTFRSGVAIPGGEHMLQVQQRMVNEVYGLALECPERVTAVVGHADPLRAVICYACGMPLDCMLRLTLHPASLTVLDIDKDGLRLVCLNTTDGALPA
jgi:broad specificity phosphatase PhoE